MEYNGVTFDITRRITQKGVKLVEEHRGEPVSLSVNNFKLFELYVDNADTIPSYKTDRGTLFYMNLKVVEVAHANYITNLINSGNVTYNITELDNRLCLNFVPKTLYSKNEYEAICTKLVIPNLYLQRECYDHVTNFSELLEKATVGYCGYYRHEWRLFLAFEGDSTLTEFIWTDEGWDYHSDVSTNLDTLSEWELLAPKDAAEATIRKSALAQFNP